MNIKKLFRQYYPSWARNDDAINKIDDDKMSDLIKRGEKQIEECGYLILSLVDNGKHFKVYFMSDLFNINNGKHKRIHFMYLFEGREYKPEPYREREDVINDYYPQSKIYLREALLDFVMHEYDLSNKLDLLITTGKTLEQYIDEWKTMTNVWKIVF